MRRRCRRVATTGGRRRAVGGDGTGPVDLDGAALLEQLLQLVTGSLDTGLHAGHGDAELGGGSLVGLAVDVDAGEGVVSRWG